MSFFSELKRRNVIRVGIAYVVTAWLLMQLTDVLIQLLQVPQVIGKVVVLFLLIGFPLALILAWAFELTPEGLRLEKNVDRSTSITPQTGKKLDRVIILALSLVVVWLLVDKFYLEPRQATTPVEQTGAAGTPASVKSLAVLPFVAMSEGKDDEYFADGLTEEIINSLAALPELLVTARTSAFHFKGQDLTIPAIAKQLGVENVVEGSVRRSGDRARITAQLVRAGDGFHLWSQTYDRTLEDVFAVQEDIAANIAQALDVVLDDSKRELMMRTGIREVDAFIAYQKGQEAFFQAHQDLNKTTELLKLATPYFEQALAAAPDLAAARVLKADAAGHVVFDLASGLRKEAFPGEELNALQALRHEYDLAWQSTPPGNQRDILDVERSLFADDWTGLAAKLDRALQPGDCPQTNWTLELAIGMGRISQALDKVREELRCDPYNPVHLFTLGFAQVWMGEPDEALRTVDDAAAKGIAFEWIDDVATYALLEQGALNDPRLGSGTDRRGFFPYPREILYRAMAGDTNEARRLAEAFWASPEAYDWAALSVAAEVGDRQRANAIAARMDARPGGALVLSNSLYVCACGAAFDLEATPNFKQKVEQAGFDWPPPTALRYPGKDW